MTASVIVLVIRAEIRTPVLIIMTVKAFPTTDLTVTSPYLGIIECLKKFDFENLTSKSSKFQ